MWHLAKLLPGDAVCVRSAVPGRPGAGQRLLRRLASLQLKPGRQARVLIAGRPAAGRLALLLLLVLLEGELRVAPVPAAGWRA